MKWQPPDWLDPRDPLVVLAGVLLAMLLAGCLLVAMDNLGWTPA